VTRFISLAEYFWLAEQVTGMEAAILISVSRVELADSALHAPQAGFGDTDFYPDPFDKAAVLACRLSWNHPLPDGNKRAAWASLLMFVEMNGGRWEPDPPDTDEAVLAMVAVAAKEMDEAQLAAWLRERVGLDP
jgi:death-on-curing protein